MTKVLITGANGQVAQELLKTAPDGMTIRAVSREGLDITDRVKVAECLQSEQPDIVINAAAYTAVDQAEEDEQTATAINGHAVGLIAELVPEDCYLLHISTDFVFDGEKNTPYVTSDQAKPQSVYGRSKLLGEQLLFEKKPKHSAIIRTAWVYSSHGKNFVNSMLRLMANRDQLNIVVDQVGTPTWAKGLAEVCWQACMAKLEGVYHWSDAGVASWFDFASVIYSLGIETGLLTNEVKIAAIPTEAYPLPAKRPAYSVLNKSELLTALPDAENKHWQQQLRDMFLEYQVKS